MGDTITEDDVATRPDEQLLEPGDHDRFSHYVDKRRFDVTEAAVLGQPVTAECGKVFVPTRDPKFKVCQDCQAIVDRRSVD